jgi:cytosine deaminase
LLDFVVRNLRLEGHAPGVPVDVGIEGGRIVAIAPGLPADVPGYDAGGRLGCAGLVETHIHLDKARLLDVLPPERGRAISPVPYVARFKPGITEADVRRRAERTLVACLLHGTTRMRTHVEVDPGIGLRGFDAIQALAAEYAWAIDIELCVFAQEGLTNRPGTDELLVQALRRGAGVIGGAPRYDSDAAAQIRRVFALAREYGTSVDLHLDVGMSPDHLDADLVCALTAQYGLGGRVALGHMTKLAAMPPDRLAATARRLADAGVAVTVLPATDLYLMGRERDHDVRRGVADAHALLAHGVNCSLASNNILNPATPFGDASLLRIANLQANVAQRGEPEELRDCFAMLTTRAARLLGLADYGIAVGNPADIAVLDAPTPAAAVAEIGEPLAVFRRGRMTVRREAARLLRPD